MIINDKDTHLKVINSFLKFLNKKTDAFVLKGGTGLSICYDLDRFSEDLDFDTNRSNITSIVKSFCKSYGYKCNQKKNTEFTKRFMIDYGVQGQLLKVETSLVNSRGFNISKDEVTIIKGYRVYKINSLAIKKLQAFMHRDKIRDMYDVAYIIVKYWNELNEFTKKSYINALNLKGLEHCQRMIDEQSDNLIRKEELDSKVLKVFDKIKEKK